jgi:hypothetical protein
VVLTAAGCSGGTGREAAPAVPQIARAAAATALSVDVAVAVPGAGAVKVRALGLEIDGDPATFAAIDLKDAAPCTRSAAGALACHATLHAPPGAQWLRVDAYANDLHGKRTSSQRALSTNDVPVDGSRVRLSLYAQAANVSVTGQSTAIAGNATSGFTIDRSDAAPATFSVVALDAAGNRVVGPGAPIFTGTPANAAFAIATPAPGEMTIAAPTIAGAAATTVDVAPSHRQVACAGGCKRSFDVALTPLATPTPGPTPTASPGASATPSPGASPSPPASPVPTPSGTPAPTAAPSASPAAIFITYSTATAPGAIRAFDEQGNAIALSGSWPNLGEPSSIVYDSANAWFYVQTAGAAETVASYGLTGNQIALANAFAATPVALAADGGANEIFAATHQGTNLDTILAYGEEGNALTLAPGFATTLVASGPNALAYDPDNNHLYFANAATGTVQEYDLSGNAVTASGGFHQPAGCAGTCVPTAVAYDRTNVWPYVIWSGAQDYVAYYSASGSTIGSFIPTVASPCAIAADTHDERLYIVGGTGVEVVDEFGNPQATSGTFPPPAGATAAAGIAVVPPSNNATRKAVRANRPRRGSGSRAAAPW